MFLGRDRSTESASPPPDEILDEGGGPPFPFYIPTPEETPAQEEIEMDCTPDCTLNIDYLTLLLRPPSASSAGSDLSWTPTPQTIVDDASKDSQDGLPTEADKDLNVDDATDVEDKIVSVPFSYEDGDGVRRECRVDVGGAELLAGQKQGYAYVGTEHEETEEEVIAREEKAKKIGWMEGWLARLNPAKHQVKPKKWVRDGKGGGCWVAVDNDKSLRVVVEWKKARLEEGRWFVESDVVEREDMRLEKLSSPPLRYKLEVTRPRARHVPGGEENMDPLTRRASRFQPPLVGRFSVEQEMLLMGKTDSR
ncbi:hypothetical protein P171DRAFT_486761 [Karstenula rhodostoma CBS 690.94]|uniref:Uncharacterized protein n=1 Tax=Karstenula rhodostoma CBS 690.94 TaxID=1392251 RepID=A0A9P4PF61_9PLEO|nr:hypothetical protein P171DRAFT_486761 [Karstenula rhodostoma CBS 690.94]